ncbi:hypothetical protein ASE93_14295 [Serratia sp. Leaf50]|nr:hypothetical protein ASE93_14295 [Serratia sp. Leaf50]
MKRVFPFLASVINGLMFIIVFISLKGHVINVNKVIPEGDICMLLYLLPGIIASFISRGENFIALFIGSVICIPLCLLVRHYFLLEIRSYWEELAYLTSAVFWSMLGVMLVTLYRVWSRQTRRQ